MPDPMGPAPEPVASPPLISGGSNVFAAIAVAALLTGGLAGIARSEASNPTALPASHAASTVDHHGDVRSAAGALTTAHGHPDGVTTAGDNPTTGAHSAHDHRTASGHRPSHPLADPGHHGQAGRTAASDLHGGHAGGGHHGGGRADSGHHQAAAGDHDHAIGCADDHPVTVALVKAVRGELATTYKDIAVLIALGYHPYFDSLVPGGYPPGGEGISHWINPAYIDDGVILDPHRPETILLDNWNWPIGMMFINDPGVAPVPVYVNRDGTPCSPWHPHTDMPARFGWYYYRAVYGRKIEGQVPPRTPEMMHVWAITNPAGVYAAHDYPPSKHRAGAPGPIPSYFSRVTVPPR